MPDAIVLNDTTWSGNAAQLMITRACVDTDTIDKGCLYVKDGIRKEFHIPRIEVAAFIVARQATPTANNSKIIVDGKILEPQDLMLYVQFNPRDFEAHFFAENLDDRILARDLPEPAQAYFMLQITKRLNEYWEYAWWQSNMNYAPGGTLAGQQPANLPPSGDFWYFNGLLAKLLGDNTVITVPSPVTLTPSNIRTQFQNAFNLVPKALRYKYGNKGLRLLVSYADQAVYEQALREDTFKNENTTEKSVNQWSGYDVVPLGGLPQGTFLFCFAKPDIDGQLWLGMNSESDMSLQLQRLQANSEEFFLKGLFKMDTQTGFGDQIVLYTLLVL